MFSFLNLSFFLSLSSMQFKSKPKLKMTFPEFISTHKWIVIWQITDFPTLLQSSLGLLTLYVLGQCQRFSWTARYKTHAVVISDYTDAKVVHGCFDTHSYTCMPTGHLIALWLYWACICLACCHIPFLLSPLSNGCSLHVASMSRR